MDNESLLLSLGVVRPSARTAASMFNDVFPDAAPRPNERHRIFDERSTIGLMLGQALNRNAPCKDAVRRLQIEFGVKASSSTAAYCRARGRVRPETVRTMSACLSAEADGLCDAHGFRRILALDATTFQMSDTVENRDEWPYAGCQRPGCGFPVASALMAHSLIGGGSEILVMAPWKAHDFRLYVESSGSFRECDLHIGDRAFCSFTAFALLREAKADGIFRGKEWCLKNSADDIILGDGDRITTWKKCWSKRSMTVSKERRESFPDEMPVRIVTATIHARGVPRREDRHRHLVDGSKEIPEGDDSQVVSSTLGDRGVIQGHEDDPALRIHSRTVSANGQAGDRGPVARLQPHALCDGEGRKERDEIPIRNRQHIGGRQILPVSHSIRVPRRKIVRKSVLTAR